MLRVKGMKEFELMETKEREEIIELFTNWLKNYTHSHVLTHSNSYRDILRDMYFA